MWATTLAIQALRIKWDTRLIAKAGILLAFAIAPSTGECRSVRSLLELRQENVVIQKWDLSCGAAALTTLLNYQHGESLTEREVAKGLMRRDEYVKNPELVQIREGFSLLDLKRYVVSRGYRGVGYGKQNLDDLIRKAPVMVPLNLHGYNHFVIFRGVAGNRVLLADPAWGNRTLVVDKFLDAWIDYPEFGRVGFVVQRADDSPPPNQLAPRESDFVMLR
jgi:predicted double-glycine peptidase